MPLTEDAAKKGPPTKGRPSQFLISIVKITLREAQIRFASVDAP
jgi:hypothetical protein